MFYFTLLSIPLHLKKKHGFVLLNFENFATYFVSFDKCIGDRRHSSIFVKYLVISSALAKRGREWFGDQQNGGQGFSSRDQSKIANNNLVKKRKRKKKLIMRRFVHEPRGSWRERLLFYFNIFISVSAVPVRFSSGLFTLMCTVSNKK